MKRSTAIIAAPYVRSAYAAGKLSIGFWDHWVPGANNTCTALINEWGAKEKVETSIDYITVKAGTFYSSYNIVPDMQHPVGL